MLKPSNNPSRLALAPIARLFLFTIPLESTIAPDKAIVFLSPILKLVWTAAEIESWLRGNRLNYRIASAARHGTLLLFMEKRSISKKLILTMQRGVGGMRSFASEYAFLAPC